MNSTRLGLVVDASGEEARVVLVSGSAVLDERVWKSERDLSRQLLTVLEELAMVHGVAWESLDRVGVVRGSGRWSSRERASEVFVSLLSLFAACPVMYLTDGGAAAAEELFGEMEE